MAGGIDTEVARTAWEHSPLATILLDEHQRIRHINPAAVLLLGRGATELRGNDWSELCTPLFQPIARTRLAAAAAPMILDMIGLRGPLTLSWHVARLADGGTLLVGVNITEEHHAQLQLRASEARFRTLVDHAPEAILVLDVDASAYVDANANAERLLGRSRDELCELDPDALAPPTQPDGRSSHLAAQAYLRQALSGETQAFEWTYRHASGAALSTEVHLLRLPDEGRRLVRASVRDVSERRHLEQLRQRSAELSEQNRLILAAARLKNDFIANMSHELRTPLNAIIGFAELLMDGRVGTLDDEQRGCISDILSSGRHLLTLVNGVLDLAKLEAERLEFFPAEVEPAALVEEVAATLRGLLGDKQLGLEVVVDPGLPSLFIDPGKLRQVLYNYLSNAIKFTPAGGHITLRLQADGPRRFRLEVTDTGIGISVADQGRLFTQFQQLDAGPGKRHQGTGLGLVLTKKLVEAQGGQVGVSSLPGQGSTFFAVLPRRAGGPQPLYTPVATARVPRVLALESSPEGRHELEATLRQAGYAVEVVATVAQALERCGSRRYDAVCFPLTPGEGSAVDFLAQLRAGGPSADAAALVTALSPEGGLVCIHVNDALARPLATDTLARALASTGVAPGPGRTVLLVDAGLSIDSTLFAAVRDLGFRPLQVATHEAALEIARTTHAEIVIVDVLAPGLDGVRLLEALRAEPGGRRPAIILWGNRALADADVQRLRTSMARAQLRGELGRARLLGELARGLGRGAVAHGMAGATP